MESNEKIQQWSQAHVFYGMLDHKPESDARKDIWDEYLWRQDVIKNSTNGRLLMDNSFFNNLQNNKIYLAHSTFNLQDVIDRGCLYSSGGCLVGSVYCTPLTPSSKGLRLHNLGRYIKDVEAPKTSKSNKKQLDTIIIEVKKKNDSVNNLIGIDYLRLGNIHYSIFKELEYLLSARERYDLSKIIVDKIRRSVDFLSLSNNYFYNKEGIESGQYLDLFIRNIDNLSILGYLYFEVVAEFLMLFQDNDLALFYAANGEFYNASYKDLMFGINSSLLENFKLNNFRPNFRDLLNFVKKRRIFKQLDEKYFLEYIVNRLVFLTNARLLNYFERPIDWRSLRWDFDNIVHYAKPLVGHLIHRELRTFGRYPDFYFYFDQNKALQIWNYWNHMDILIPFNGVIPKGEIGINSAYPDLKYKIYQSKVVCESKDGFCYLKPDKELKISLVPRLVDLKFTFMRNKHKHV